MREEESFIAPKTLRECSGRSEFTDLEKVWREPWCRRVVRLIKGQNIKHRRSSRDCIALQLFKEAAAPICLWKIFFWDEHHEVGEVWVIHRCTILSELSKV